MDRLAEALQRLNEDLAASVGDIGGTPGNELRSFVEAVLRTEGAVVLQTLTLSAGKLHLVLVDLGYSGETALLAIAVTHEHSAAWRVRLSEVRVVHDFGGAPTPELTKKRRVILTMTSFKRGASPWSKVFDLELRELNAIRGLAEHPSVRSLVSFLPAVRSDGRGRVTIPRRLVQQARLVDRVLVLGAVTHIELWDPEVFETAIKETAELFRKLDADN